MPDTGAAWRRPIAGIDTAVVPEKARAMMIDYDTIVRHYEVIG